MIRLKNIKAMIWNTCFSDSNKSKIACKNSHSKNFVNLESVNRLDTKSHLRFSFYANKKSVGLN